MFCYSLFLSDNSIILLSCYMSRIKPKLITSEKNHNPLEDAATPIRNISHSIIIRETLPMRIKSCTMPVMPMRIKRDRWTAPMRNMGHRLYFQRGTCLCEKLRVIAVKRGHLYEYVRQLWNFHLYAQLRIVALRSQFVTSKTMRICQTAVKELRHLCAIVQQL